ncbi:helix-turn-helix domain-containing protein [Roseateles albus]|uniref:helix-turn-helix domain-containing protein n=1 Tax=Roseateles albus TaxID=2987525 RepID=UPI0039647F45
MLTLTLIEAASLLKVHPKTLQKLAQRGGVPACKVGRSWVFVEQLLIDQLVSRSKARLTVADDQEFSECLSTNAKIRPSGGSSSLPSVASRSLYSKALGLVTSGKRSKSMTA